MRALDGDHLALGRDRRRAVRERGLVGDVGVRERNRTAWGRRLADVWNRRRGQPDGPLVGQPEAVHENMARHQALPGLLKSAAPLCPASELAQTSVRGPLA